MGAPLARPEGGAPPSGVAGVEPGGPLCPSAPCAEGSALLGVVQKDGRVALLPQVLPLDAAFVARAHEGRRPESRFRFTAPCLTSGCAQWRDGGCSVGARAAALPQAQAPEAPLPACAIRERCRWWLQEGPVACRVCPEVVTDTRTA